MSGSRVSGLAFIVLMTVVLSGCSPFTTPRSIDLDADDVATVELYEYPWGEEHATVDRATIVNTEANREVVEELVAMFTDMPTSPLDSSVTDEVAGKQALGVRYSLRDGSSTAISRIFIAHHEVVVIWPDGNADHTEWGVPDLVDYYGEFGVVEQVDAAERPKAELQLGG